MKEWCLMNQNILINTLECHENVLEGSILIGMKYFLVLVWTFSKLSRFRAVDKWHIVPSWLLRKFCLSPWGENGPSAACLCFGTSCKMIHERYTKSHNRHFAFHVMGHLIRRDLLNTNKQCFIRASCQYCLNKANVWHWQLKPDYPYIRSILFVNIICSIVLKLFL